MPADTPPAAEPDTHARIMAALDRMIPVGDHETHLNDTYRRAIADVLAPMMAATVTARKDRP